MKTLPDGTSFTDFMKEKRESTKSKESKQSDEVKEEIKEEVKEEVKEKSSGSNDCQPNSSCNCSCKNSGKSSDFSLGDIMRVVGPFLPTILSMLSRPSTKVISSSSDNSNEMEELYKSGNLIWDQLDCIENKKVRSIVFLSKLSELTNTFLKKYESKSTGWMSDSLKGAQEKFTREINSVMDQLANR